MPPGTQPGLLNPPSEQTEMKKGFVHGDANSLNTCSVLSGEGSMFVDVQLSWTIMRTVLRMRPLVDVWLGALSGYSREDL